MDLLCYAYVGIHQVRRLVFDNYQGCPVSLRWHSMTDLKGRRSILGNSVVSSFPLLFPFVHSVTKWNSNLPLLKNSQLSFHYIPDSLNGIFDHGDLREVDGCETNDIVFKQNQNPQNMINRQRTKLCIFCSFIRPFTTNFKRINVSLHDIFVTQLWYRCKSREITQNQQHKLNNKTKGRKRWWF